MMPRRVEHQLGESAGNPPGASGVLLGALMTGDDDFEDFYQASHLRLVGQLTVLAGNLEDAGDAVQEAFARASTRWARLRTLASRRAVAALALTAVRRPAVY
jgi:DNA-directed RNA polymerase specialized sigma24 family protein